MKSAEVITHDPRPPAQRSTALQRHARWILVALVLLGCAARLAQYLAHRSYWHDEAFLVLNVMEKSAGQLLGPLTIGQAPPQAAPPLFLLLQRALYVSLGGSEWVMRLIPLTLGCAAVIVFTLLVRRRLAPAGAILAAALFALSDRLIWHASEAKQYSSDAFIAVTLLAVMLWHTSGAWRRLRYVAPLAAGAIWFAHPALFIFAGYSLALLVRLVRVIRARRRGMRFVGRFLLLNALVAGSLGLLWWLSIRVQQHPHFYQYWHDRFMPLTWWRIPAWLLSQSYKLCDYPFPPGGILVAALAILGAIVALRTRRGTTRRMMAMSAILPIALVLLAALLRQYPFGGHRLTLFLAPGLFLLSGLGAQTLAQARPRWLAFIPIALVAAGLVMVGYHLVVPRTRAHIRPAVEYVLAHRQPDDGICVVHVEEFLCYWREPREPLLLGVPPTGQIPAHWRRFWVVWSYSRPDKAQRNAAGALEHARAIADERPEHSFHGSGGAAVLFERRQSPQ